MQFTEKDKIILESYKNLVYGLADYLGPDSEVVLHSLENYESSVTEIAGQNTNRKKGAPITDLALNMLKEMNDSNNKISFLTYFTKSKNDKKMKSSTIAIYGENKRIIGLLCINYNLECSLIDFIKNFTYIDDEYENHENKKVKLNENFSNTVEELINESVERIRKKVESNDEISNNNKNKEIIKKLHEDGIFNMKDSVLTVAKKLKISKNTVYLHLRNIEK